MAKSKATTQPEKADVETNEQVIPTIDVAEQVQVTDESTSEDLAQATTQPEKADVESDASPSSDSTKVMVIGEDQPGHNLVIQQVSVEESVKQQNVSSDSSTKVLIQYPEDWNKAKYMKDGDIKHVSADIANSFVEMGIGTIITD